MESDRFDALARRLGHAHSRRGLLGAGLAAFTTRVGLAAAVDPAARCSAKKPCPVCFTCHKRKCHVASDGTPCANGACQAGQCVCTPNCNHKICGDDGCGGSCGTCPTGQLCTAAGTCQDSCPHGQRFCQGNCIPITHCCTDDDCDADQTCCPDGSCANLQSSPLNCGACGASCPVNETCVAGACDCGGQGTAAPFTCCPPDNTQACAPAGAPQFTFPLTCTGVAVCPTGSTVCIGSTSPPGQPGITGCQVCCPAGTTCDATEGVCLQQPPTDRAKRRAKTH